MPNDPIEPETGPAIASDSIDAPEAEIVTAPEVEVAEGGEPREMAPGDEESDELESNDSGDGDVNAEVPDESEIEEPGPSEHPELADKSLRILEALLFASAEPLGASQLAPHVERTSRTAKIPGRSDVVDIGPPPFAIGDCRSHLVLRRSHSASPRCRRTKSVMVPKPGAACAARDERGTVRRWERR